MPASPSRHAVHPEHALRMTTSELRSHFLIENLFEPGAIRQVYSHHDRLIIGGAFPVDKALKLEPFDELKAGYFLERREIGIINVGQEGTVIVDGKSYQLGNKDALYAGMGVREITFSPAPGKKVLFYFNSAPAHMTHPTRKISVGEADTANLGAVETANQRTIRKLIVSTVLPTCRLQMGLTELKAGSVWNTIPPHIHSRRMEAYFYFDLAEEHRVSHFMGEPAETRHLWVSNHQAVISPPWSIHAGAGTSAYSFIWGMSGENLDYTDMDAVPVSQLK
jgi:4-deoxy-L-threo-5-hexosulose-uronate ketol-isomerase